MPNNDKSGPEGEGPNTGRGLGPCKEKPKNDDIFQKDRPQRKDRPFGWGRQRRQRGRK